MNNERPSSILIRIADAFINPDPVLATYAATASGVMGGLELKMASQTTGSAHEMALIAGVGTLVAVGTVVAVPALHRLLNRQPEITTLGLNA